MMNCVLYAKGYVCATLVDQSYWHCTHTRLVAASLRYAIITQPLLTTHTCYAAFKMSICGQSTSLMWPMQSKAHVQHLFKQVANALLLCCIHYILMRKTEQ